MKLSKLEWSALIITFLSLLVMVSFFLFVILSSQPVLITTERNDAPPPSVQMGNSSRPDPSQPPFPININTASEASLILLPGIGEKRAQAIVAYREEHGSFLFPSQLLEVEGIGQTTLDGIIDYITFN